MISEISLIYTGLRQKCRGKLPRLVMSSRLLINFSQFVMLPVDKYDKYTSQQIYTPRSRGRYQPATLGGDRPDFTFLFSAEFFPLQQLMLNICSFGFSCKYIYCNWQVLSIPGRGEANLYRYKALLFHQFRTINFGFLLISELIISQPAQWLPVKTVWNTMKDNYYQTECRLK